MFRMPCPRRNNCNLRRDGGAGSAFATLALLCEATSPDWQLWPQSSGPPSDARLDRVGQTQARDRFHLSAGADWRGVRQAARRKCVGENSDRTLRTSIGGGLRNHLMHRAYRDRHVADFDMAGLIMEPVLPPIAAGLN